MTIMLEVVYEGSEGKIKCEKCECWLGFKPADHLITAPCPTCENPLVVPPQVLSFPDVQKAPSIDLKPKKREAVSLPSFPERASAMKPAREEVTRLDAEVMVSETPSISFPDRPSLQQGQVSLPATRQPAGATDNFQMGEIPPLATRGVSPVNAPEGITQSAEPEMHRAFKARLQSAPNDGQHDGFTGNVKKGFVGSLQRMTGFLSVLAILMIVGILTAVLFNKEEQASTETIELNLSEKTTPAVEHDSTQGLVNAP